MNEHFENRRYSCERSSVSVVMKGLIQRCHTVILDITYKDSRSG
jgi:hypothetical protein